MLFVALLDRAINATQELLVGMKVGVAIGVQALGGLVTTRIPETPLPVRDGPKAAGISSTAVNVRPFKSCKTTVAAVKVMRDAKARDAASS